MATAAMPARLQSLGAQRQQAQLKLIGCPNPSPAKLKAAGATILLVPAAAMTPPLSTTLTLTAAAVRSCVTTKPQIEWASSYPGHLKQLPCPFQQFVDPTAADCPHNSQSAKTHQAHLRFIWLQLQPLQIRRHKCSNRHSTTSCTSSSQPSSNSIRAL